MTTENPRPRTFAELVDTQCASHPDFTILTVVDIAPDGALRDQTRTFAQLRANGRRLAHVLRGAGVGAGDRFALMLHNHAEFVEAMVAAALIGAAFVPIDPRSVGDKLVYMLNVIESRVVIAGDYALPALHAAAAQLSHVERVIVVGGSGPSPEGPVPFAVSAYDSAIATAPEEVVAATPDTDAIMFMMFTSGTTGHPKAVARTHGRYMAAVKSLRALGVRDGDTLFTGLPLSHINAHATLCAGFSMVLPVVISKRFSKSRLWDICRTYGCTVFTLLGGMIPEIFFAPARADDADNPVRLVISSGMPASLWNAYRERFGLEITEVYGSTEAGGVLINLQGEGPPGSMGKPPKGTRAAILDEAGAPCPPGAPGELCFRPETGDATPVVYFRNEDASRRKVDGGWFRSGDIAHMDENGWFYFHHRIGGGVRRNGDFVNTTLVETVLAQSPLVADVFVYGVATPANVAGEKSLAAAIVLAPGACAEDVRAWCAGRLQKNETPEIWQVLAEIPKTVSEKPIERACIALLQRDLILSEPVS